MGSIAARNNLAHSGNHLSDGCKMAKPGMVVTNSPHAEHKDAIGSYTIIRANPYLIGQRKRPYPKKPGENLGI